MRGKHPWDIVDTILLVGKLASVITLICTCTLVWNPYLQTSSFYWGECYTAQIRYTNIQYCNGQNMQQCATPDFTLPTGYQNITATLPFTRITTTTTTTVSPSSTTTTTSIASSATTTTPANSQSSTATSTIPSSTALSISITQASSSSSTVQISSTTSNSTAKRRKRSSDENYCIGFPCMQVIVIFKNQDFGPTEVGIQLWDNYDDLQNYPQCSISSCDSNDNDNFDNVEAFMTTMEQYQTNQQTFGCYINYNDLNQILLNVNGSYPAAINSILWPILFLIFFFCALLAHRFRDGCGRTPRRPPPAYDATYGVGNAGMGEVAIVEGAGGNYYPTVGMATGVASGGTEKNVAALGVEMGAASQVGPSAPYAEIGLEKY